MSDQSQSPACRFRFRPKLFPQVENQIESVTWDYVKKSLTITAHETAGFDVLLWMQHIVSSQQSVEKSPFADTESNTALLIFVNEHDAAIAEVKVRNLNLVEHQSFSSKARIDSTPLSHVVTISYESCDLSTLDRRMTNLI